MSESNTYPPPPFEVPAVGWNGGSCTEKATFSSNGRTGTFSKQCRADYQVTSNGFPGASQYTANFFEKNATASLFIRSGTSASLSGWVGGPTPTLDMLPGPTLLDRIVMSAFDAGGHLLAQGVGCVHGCLGWPAER